MKSNNSSASDSANKEPVRSGKTDGNSGSQSLSNNSSQETKIKQGDSGFKSQPENKEPEELNSKPYLDSVKFQSSGSQSLSDKIEFEGQTLHVVDVKESIKNIFEDCEKNLIDGNKIKYSVLVQIIKKRVGDKLI